MCGIGGILFPENRAVDLQALKLMGESISHRGPDQEGFWINNEASVGFVHKRLSIIDLSEKGRQPMHYLGRYTIVFNGEIYNYIEIRNDLEKKGVVFSTVNDTEVILASFHVYREKCLEHFNGMFAFAIWDSETKQLFCARDRFGEKPFFYHFNGKTFHFCSEIKGLFAAGVERSVSRQMLYRYLKWDLIENPLDPEETFYNNIKRLPPSCYLEIKNSELYCRKYWDINLENKAPAIEIQDAAENYLEILKDSVKIRLRSDVPVGSSLSGGLDSSSIVSIVNSIKEPGHKQFTFSARFHEKEFDEGYFIDIMTGNCDLTPLNTYPDENLFLSQIEKIFHHQEEPFGSASIVAQWEVMKLARKNNITVLLDGQGADEILAGYQKYPEIFLREMMKKSVGRFKAERKGILDVLGKNYSANSIFLTETFFPGMLRFGGRVKRSLLSDKDNITFNKDFINSISKERPPFTNYNTINETLYHDTFKYGLKNLLRFCDRNAMAFGVEVRLPYLDHRLVEFVFSLPSGFKIKGGYSKYIHRKAMENSLPGEICWRKDKMSYQVPQDQWLKKKKTKDLLESAKTLLVNENILSGKTTHDPWQMIMASFMLR